jgi:hypothetical protein
MRKTIQSYEGIMISKIFSCKTTFEVLSIIDNKVELIKKKTPDKTIVARFIEDSLFNLRYANEKEIQPDQFSKIRAAIGHLRNLKTRYTVF